MRNLDLSVSKNMEVEKQVLAFEELIIERIGPPWKELHEINPDNDSKLY